jgi:hypothetical protein
MVDCPGSWTSAVRDRIVFEHAQGRPARVLVPLYERQPSTHVGPKKTRSSAEKQKDREVDQAYKSTTEKILTEMPRSIPGMTCAARVRHATAKPSHDGRAGKPGASVVWRARIDARTCLCGGVGARGFTEKFCCDIEPGRERERHTDGGFTF